MQENQRKVPKSKVHPRNRKSPQHEQWRRSIGVGVKQASARRRRKGLLSVPDLARLSDLPQSAIRAFMDRGELLFVQVNERRFVRVEEWRRYWRSKVKAA